MKFFSRIRNLIFFRRIVQILFCFWGIGVLGFYFFDYPYYGSALLIGLTTLLNLIILGMMIWFILFLFPISIGKFLNFKKIETWIFWLRGGIGMGRNVEIPVMIIPLFFLMATVFWNVYIYFRSGNIGIVKNNILALGVTFFVGICAFGLGRIILKKINIFDFDRIGNIVVSLALGFSAMMLGMFFLGISGLFYRSAVIVILLFIFFVSRREIFDLWKFLKQKRIIWKMRSFISFGNIATVFILVILAIYLGGIFQQYPLGFDGTISYLTYPKEYAESHKIINFPHWIYYGFPQNGEMLFTLGFLLFNFQVALGIIFCFLLLSVLGIVWVFRLNNWKGGRLAVLTFLSIPVVAYQMLQDHKIEIIFLLYTFLAYIFLIRYWKNKDVKDLLLLSIFSGVAAGLKYFFLPWYGVPLVGGILWLAIRRRIPFRHIALFLGVVFFLQLPWLTRNFIFSGNPIDPILSERLAFRQHFYNSLGNGSQKFIVEEMRNEGLLIWDYREDKNLNFWSELPFFLTYLGNKKYHSDGINMGPILLIGLPVLIFGFLKGLWGKKYGPYFWPVSSAIVLLVLGWVYVGRLVMWYGLTLFLFWTICVALLVSKSNSKTRAIFYSLVLAWSISFISIQLYSLPRNNIYYETQLESKDGLIKMSEHINKKIPSESLVWGVDEPRGFFINNSAEKFIPDNYLLAFSFLLRNYPEVEVIEKVKNLGVTHFLFAGTDNSPNVTLRMIWANFETGSKKYANFTLDNNLNFMRFRDKHLILEYGVGDYFLYRWRE
jgi:hypothetical protein